MRRRIFLYAGPSLTPFTVNYPNNVLRVIESGGGAVALHISNASFDLSFSLSLIVLSIRRGKPRRQLAVNFNSVYYYIVPPTLTY